MNPEIKKKITDDGTIDNDYTWGRPVTTYVSPYQHLRLLAMKGRLEAAGVLMRLRANAS
jgi:hypothetical protein